MPVGFADHRAGFEPEQIHDLVAVDIGADRVEVLFLLQLAHAIFHLVHGAGEHHRLAAVLRGGVGACKAVQTLVQMASVFHIASDRGIRPRLIHIAVEP